jgi:hypothetical protein
MAPPPRQASDRRRSPRYPVDVPLEFCAVLASGVAVSGAARTVNLSDSGLLFEGEDSLPPGSQIQVFIDWPARPGSTLSVQLCGRGLTVHRRGNATAVAIHQCEFHAAPNLPAEWAMGTASLRPAV